MPAASKSLFFRLGILFILLSFSCKRSHHSAPLGELTISLEESNLSLQVSSDQIVRELLDKTYDLATRERALIWHPKAEHVLLMTDSLYNYLERLKKKDDISREMAAEIFNKLNNYKNNLLNTDTTLRLQYEKSLHLYGNPSDTTIITQKEFYKIYFSNTSKQNIATMITALQNRIRLAANKAVTFCSLKMGMLDGPGFFDATSAIIAQSATILRPGDILEITAGVGDFSRKNNPAVTVNGQSISPGEEFVFQHKIKVPAIPGHYHIPVKVSYFNEITRKVEVLNKNIEYTVAKPCSQ